MYVSFDTQQEYEEHIELIVKRTLDIMKGKPVGQKAEISRNEMIQRVGYNTFYNWVNTGILNIQKTSDAKTGRVFASRSHFEAVIKQQRIPTNILKQ